MLCKGRNASYAIATSAALAGAFARATSDSGGVRSKATVVKSMYPVLDRERRKAVYTTMDVPACNANDMRLRHQSTMLLFPHVPLPVRAFQLATASINVCSSAHAAPYTSNAAGTST